MLYFFENCIFDPLGQPTVTIGIIVFAHVVRPFVPTIQNLTMFATGETLGLAEWIIDDTCLVKKLFFRFYVLSVIILPILFYIPKFFEVRSAEVASNRTYPLDCTDFLKQLDTSGAGSENENSQRRGFMGFAHQSMAIFNDTYTYPSQCLPFKDV